MPPKCDVIVFAPLRTPDPRHVLYGHPFIAFFIAHQPTTGERYMLARACHLAAYDVRLISILRLRRARRIRGMSFSLGSACVCVNVSVMVFIAGVFLLLQTMIRSTATKVGQGEAEGKTEDGDKKNRKTKLSRNLKVI